MPGEEEETAGGGGVGGGGGGGGCGRRASERREEARRVSERWCVLPRGEDARGGREGGGDARRGAELGGRRASGGGGRRTGARNDRSAVDIPRLDRSVRGSGRGRGWGAGEVRGTRDARAPVMSRGMVEETGVGGGDEGGAPTGRARRSARRARSSVFPSNHDARYVTDEPRKGNRRATRSDCDGRGFVIRKCDRIIRSSAFASGGSTSARIDRRSALTRKRAGFNSSFLGLG